MGNVKIEDCIDEFCGDFRRRWIINCPSKCDKKKTALTAKKEPSATSPAAMAGSTPEIGKTLVCKTSKNIHRMSITTQAQVDMIVDLFLDEKPGWSIEA